MVQKERKRQSDVNQMRGSGQKNERCEQVNITLYVEFC